MGAPYSGENGVFFGGLAVSDRCRRRRSGRLTVSVNRILVRTSCRHPAGNQFPTGKSLFSDFSFHPARLARRVHSFLSVRRERPRFRSLARLVGGENRSELASIPSVPSGPRSLGEESLVFLRSSLCLVLFGVRSVLFGVRFWWLGPPFRIPVLSPWRDRHEHRQVPVGRFVMRSHAPRPRSVHGAGWNPRRVDPDAAVKSGRVRRYTVSPVHLSSISSTFRPRTGADSQRNRS